MVGASLSELFAASEAANSSGPALHSAHGLLVFGLVQSVRAIVGALDGLKSVDTAIDRKKGGMGN